MPPRSGPAKVESRDRAETLLFLKIRTSSRHFSDLATSVGSNGDLSTTNRECHQFKSKLPHGLRSPLSHGRGAVLHRLIFHAVCTSFIWCTRYSIRLPLWHLRQITLVTLGRAPQHSCTHAANRSAASLVPQDGAVSANELKASGKARK
jgi:hypothetical protein